MRKGVLAAAGGALLAALISWNAQAMPISAPAALKDAGESLALTENVHYYGYGYGYRPYYRPYGYYRPYSYGYHRPYYRPYSYGYRPYYRPYAYGYYRPYPAWVSGPYYAPRPRFYIGPSVYWY